MIVCFFSIVVPVYNKELHLIKCISSLIDQTYQDFEVIFVDDGSKDGSAELIRLTSDCRIKLIQKENGGVSSARNLGILCASGKYICFLDADDFYSPNFLHEVSYLIEKNKNGVFFATAYYSKSNGRLRRSLSPKMVLNGSEIIQDFYFNWALGAFFCASSAVVARDFLLAENIRFPEGESNGEDQDFWFQLAEKTNIIFLNKPLSTYVRGINDSLTSSAVILEKLPYIKRLEERINLGDVGIQNVNSAKMIINRIRLELSVNHAFFGSKVQAIKVFTKGGGTKGCAKLKSLVVLGLLCPRLVFNMYRKFKRALK
ncbi:glycosyltransferase family 2 protein [Deefgea piscis]|uniref:Glycosyltransferase family 2 protein n=1 Tax=Deefgea piscis TaxID=2739061 RepID=A0A6M8SRT1_9NEIS|nr:glycosyltransferase family 2 protein [Deefgea piscis]QKJ65569.1 glycosyltransferase family 2 protein [Deefgea piscis]